ncbi:MAG: hypothetical protein AAF586_05580 [Planctomycetota bacterium]
MIHARLGIVTLMLCLLAFGGVVFTPGNQSDAFNNASPYYGKLKVDKIQERIKERLDVILEVKKKKLTIKDNESGKKADSAKGSIKPVTPIDPSLSSVIDSIKKGSIRLNNCRLKFEAGDYKITINRKSRFTIKLKGSGQIIAGGKASDFEAVLKAVMEE